LFVFWERSCLARLSATSRLALRIFRKQVGWGARNRLPVQSTKGFMPKSLKAGRSLG
jgi:hypothetical protein